MIASVSVLSCVVTRLENISVRLGKSFVCFGNRLLGPLVRKRLNKISALRRHTLWRHALQRHGSWAFTLVELLVVIAIIGVLIALLLPAVQYVYETEVVLSRPARRNVKNKRVSVPGKPLTLRLVIVKLLDKKTGDELSCWRLFTNVPGDVSSEQIALWYYYRWDIESYFKLMKAGGKVKSEKLQR